MVTGAGRRCGDDKGLQIMESDKNQIRERWWANENSRRRYNGHGGRILYDWQVGQENETGLAWLEKGCV